MTGAVAGGTTGMLDEWEITELKDIVEINPESRDPTQNPDEKFSYIDIDSVENGSGAINSVKDLLGKDAPSRARRIVRTDDVIMSEVRPYLKAFALVPKKLNNQICSTGFAVLRSKGAVDPKYLLNTLFSDAVIEQCNRMMVGAQYPALNDSQVRKIQIPLPPLPEQRRIAVILTTVDDAIQISRQAATETERLKAGVMHELMTKGIGHTEFREDPDVGRVPKTWDALTADELLNNGALTLLQDGNHGELYPRIKDFSNFGKPFLAASCIDGLGKIDFNNAPKLPEIKSKQLRIGFGKGGDILLTHNATVGKVGLAQMDAPEFIASTSTTIYRTNKEKMDSVFLFHYLRSDHYQNQLRQVMRQSTRNQVPITKQKTLVVLFPPLTEQQQIATILTIIDRKLDLQRQRTAHYEYLKQGLMNELLTGRQRVKVT